MNAAPEIAFSSEQGKANYAAARRQYPAQAIVNLKTMRDNMAHLVSVVGGPNSGTAVMGVVKADAYGHGLLPAALAALAGTISYEIFTCLRNRIPRLYEHAAEVLPAADLAKLDPATLL